MSSAIIIYAHTAEQALQDAPAEYGIVVELEPEFDGFFQLEEKAFAVFKTTADRDLWFSQE